MINRKLRLTLSGTLCIALLTALGACEKQGPLERAGEEIDEAGRAIKNGGEQTTADKIDDKVDRARDELKKDSK